MRDKLRYYWGRIFGSICGTNSLELARQCIQEDIRRAKRDIRVVSCTANVSHWDELVVGLLEQKAHDNPDLRIEFIIGPEFSNDSLERLEQNGVVRIIRLHEAPPCDCRIVDNRDTYTTNHSNNETSRRYCRTFGNVKAVRDRNAYYESLKRKAA